MINIMSLLFRSVLILILLFMVPTLASAEKYRFVTFEYPPYEYTENGELKGIATEIIRDVFRQMKHELEIEVYPWARCIEMFKNGDVDGIFTIFKTQEREAFTIFSKEAVVSQPVSLWTLKSSNIKFNNDLNSLKEYRFCTIRRISYGSRIDTALTQGLLSTDESDNVDSCINKLLVGRIDIWASNRYGAIYELKRTGNLDKVKELFPSVQETASYVGFSKKRNLEKLKSDFDKTLAKYKKNGKYTKIINSYIK